jgi:hypothetical protein
MKTCSLFGFITSLGGAFLTLALYLAGFHSSEDKLAAAGYIAMGVGLTISIVCMVLGVRARRDETPLEKDFGYAQALGAGVLIALVSSVLSSAFSFIYLQFINPGLIDLEISQQIHKLEAKGISGDGLDKAEAGIRMFMGVVPQTIIALGDGSPRGGHLGADRCGFCPPGAHHAPESLKKRGPGLLRALEFWVLVSRLAAERALPVETVVEGHHGTQTDNAEVSCDNGNRCHGTKRKQDCSNGEDRRGSRSDDVCFHMMYFFVSLNPRVL